MTDLQGKRELAIEAKEIIESKSFDKAKADLREALVNELLTASRERRDDVIAKLRVLESVFGRLRALINDYNAGVRAQAKGPQSHLGRVAHG